MSMTMIFRIFHEHSSFQYNIWIYLERLRWPPPLLCITLDFSSFGSLFVPLEWYLVFSYWIIITTGIKKSMFNCTNMIQWNFVLSWILNLEGPSKEHKFNCTTFTVARFDVILFIIIKVVTLMFLRRDQSLYFSVIWKRVLWRG
jgi:hypothetical protein